MMFLLVMELLLVLVMLLVVMLLPVLVLLHVVVLPLVTLSAVLRIRTFLQDPDRNKMSESCSGSGSGRTNIIQSVKILHKQCIKQFNYAT